MLKLQNVSFSYSSDKSVFEDINLTIDKNDLFILKGESGSGKSTLLKLLNRFNEPTDGTIYFHEKDIKEYEITDIRRSIVYLPQLPYMIDGTVEDNLLIPFSFKAHKSKQFSTEKAEEWLKYFQLHVSLKDEAIRLSVGQKQRIALIRAMILEPEVLLLDEPGSSLDSKNKQLIEKKIEELVSSRTITILMATHSALSDSLGQHCVLSIKDRHLENENAKCNN